VKAKWEELQTFEDEKPEFDPTSKTTTSTTTTTTTQRNSTIIVDASM
jgi:hypothetical protein